MKNEDNIKHDCPSPEVLSACFDGELPENCPEAKHIRECVHCTRQIQLMELFAKSLKKHFTSVDESALVGRITAGVHKQLDSEDKTRNTHHFMSLAFRLAAAVVICLSAVVFLMRGEPVAIASDSEPHSGSNAPLAHDFPYYTDSQSQLGSLASKGSSIPLHNLVSVDFGNSSTPVFSGAKQLGNYAAAKEQPVAISDLVTQVWIVKNLHATEKSLKKILHQEGVPQITHKISASNGIVELYARISKMQLVKLVRACNKAGFDLVSPVAPQPEQNAFKGSANAPVLYKAKFVVNN